MDLPSNSPTPVSVEPNSLDARLVVGGQRISIRVSVEPEPVVDSNKFHETKSTKSFDMSEDDIYLLLKGPAHITPLADGRIEVAFLNGENKRKQSLFFNLKPDEDPQKEGKKVLKVVSLDLILECNKAEFEALTSVDKQNIFPDIIYEIKEDDLNQEGMNPIDPPIKL